MRDKPYTYLKKALSLFNSFNGQVVVELGSMRSLLTHNIDDFSHDCCYDGHSSIILALESPEFYTVDINPENTAITAKIFEEFKISNRARAIQGDGIEFLKNFDKKIDFLYLDAWDVDHQDTAEKHYEAFKACESKLSHNNIILIDDTDINSATGQKGGKGALLIPYLLEQNYNMLFSGRQTCFYKNL
jgi:hypothetical protein